LHLILFNCGDWAALDAGRISLPAELDLKKQGKSGSGAPAPREALYLCMRERGNGADEPESPPSFLNEIRTAINSARRYAKFGCGYKPP